MLIKGCPHYCLLPSSSKHALLQMPLSSHFHVFPEISFCEPIQQKSNYAKNSLGQLSRKPDKCQCKEKYWETCLGWNLGCLFSGSCSGSSSYTQRKQHIRGCLALWDTFFPNWSYLFQCFYLSCCFTGNSLFLQVQTTSNRETPITLHMTSNFILSSYIARRKQVWKSRADCSVLLELWQSSYKIFKKASGSTLSQHCKRGHHVSSSLAHPAHSEPIQWYLWRFLFREKKNPQPWTYPHLLGFTYSFDCKYPRDHLLGSLFESHSSRSQKNVGHPINPLSPGPHARKQLKGLAFGVCCQYTCLGQSSASSCCSLDLLIWMRGVVIVFSQMLLKTQRTKCQFFIPELFQNFHPLVEWLALPAVKR